MDREGGSELRAPAEARARIERISANDLTNLATDRGPVPMNLGAVLVVEGGDAGAAALDLEAVRGLLGRRISRVPRLRQVLRSTPFGAGRPVWVDDETFEIGRHVTGRVAHDETELLGIAADLARTPLPRDRPLWRACWVSGLPGACAALVLVVHHVLTDGLGGLAVLAALCDREVEADEADDVDADGVGAHGVWAGAATSHFREPPVASRPTPHALRADARRERLLALSHAWSHTLAAGRGVRELMVARDAQTAGSGRSRGHRGLKLVARTSLNRPTGPRRRFTTVDLALADVLDAAHSHGCTVNDLLLSAIGGALGGVLERRGEHPPELVVSVPVSVRRSTTADRLGNDTGVAPVAVPVSMGPRDRLDTVAARTRVRRATGSRGASALPLGLAFRLLGRLGVFRLFVDHQRLVHTFVTNVRGPSEPLHVGGRPVTEVLPFALTPGNVGVSFDVLSYAGRLVVTIVADPDVVPEQELLTQLVADEVAALTQPS